MAQYINLLKGNKSEILIAMNKNDPKLFDIYRLNILTGETVMVAQNPGNITGWLTDSNGKLDWQLYRWNRVDYSIQGKGRNQFKPLLSTNWVKLLALSCFQKIHSLYAASNIGRDTAAIVKLD
jgi:hypothetical protein